ncbi:MAG: hypothetical protein KBT47_05545 [Armatimonadetes bacterium]|nr:hypothetical protein [Candidatus Hippobium faecium]
MNEQEQKMKNQILEENFSDISVADYFAQMNNNSLVYNRDTNRFYRWNQQYWEETDRNRVKRDLIFCLRCLKEDPIFSYTPSANALKKLLNDSKIENILQSFLTVEGISKKNEEFDLGKSVINCKNGIFDIETGHLMKHWKDLYITKYTDCEYISDPDKAYPKKFMEFMKQIFQNDMDLIDYMLKLFGYCFTGYMNEEKFFIFYGKGSTGKSKLTEIIGTVMGDYAETAPNDIFVENSSNTTNGIIDVAQARLGLLSETGEYERLNEPLIKQITGRDKIKARPLYKEYFTLEPQCKLILCTNDIPHFASMGKDMRRRLRIIPFRQTFSDNPGIYGLPKDPEIVSKVLEEKDKIFTFLMRYACKWRKEKLGETRAVTEATRDIFEDENRLSFWLENCTEENPKFFTPVADLYNSYIAHCMQNHIKPSFTNIATFSRYLNKMDKYISTKNNDIRGFLGISLQV